MKYRVRWIARDVGDVDMFAEEWKRMLMASNLRHGHINDPLGSWTAPSPLFSRPRKGRATGKDGETTTVSVVEFKAPSLLAPTGWRKEKGVIAAVGYVLGSKTGG